jgi:hypothetical protein
MLPRYPTRLLAALAVACSAACSDNDDPTGPVVDTIEQLIARCSRATISDATTTETVTGSINSGDCRISDDPDEGRLEGYLLPQSAFGDMTTVQIELTAPFDGSIVVYDTDGNFIGEIDETFSGTEMGFLDWDDSPSESDFFVIVYSYDGDDSGNYTLSVGPVDPI